jgi:hypothetical protein
MPAITSLLPFIAAALLCLVCLLSLFTLRKVRAMHVLLYGLQDRAQQEPATLFRQIEALQGLYIELGLE